MNESFPLDISPEMLKLAKVIPLFKTVALCQLQFIEKHLCCLLLVRFLKN